MPSTPTNIGTAVLRTLHRIHRQLTDFRGVSTTARKVPAAEFNVRHRETC